MNSFDPNAGFLFGRDLDYHRSPNHLKRQSEEKDFTPEQEIRFATFYSDFRSGLEDAYFRRLAKSKNSKNQL